MYFVRVINNCYPTHPIVKKVLNTYGNLYLIYYLNIFHRQLDTFIYKNYNYTIPENSLTTRIWSFYYIYNSICTYVEDQTIGKIALFVKSKLHFLNQFSDENFTAVCTAPISEELFRYLNQEVFLRILPQLILNQLLPDKVYLIDNKWSKIVRVLASGINFALLHINLWGKGKLAKEGINSQLLGGLLSGSLMEYKRNVFYPILLHMVHNLHI